MADADEDLIPALDPARHSRQTGINGEDGGASEDDSDSDAAPDYRFLSSTTASAKHALPSRGTKDFEPVPTARQANTLDLSRKAMTDALSVVRVHTVTKKQENIGVYFADPAEWDGQKYEQKFLSQVEDLEKRQKMNSPLAAGEGRCVAVEKFTTTYGRTIGRNDRRNWTWLLPEEALFLLERGSLDIRYTSEADPNHSVEADDGENADHDPEKPQLSIGEVPMSLQGAYAAFIDKGGLTLERYQVYANLRRTGYVVQRAPTWYGPVVSSTDLQLQTQALAAASDDFVRLHTIPQSSETGLLYRLFFWLFDTTLKPSTTQCFNPVLGPLIRPGLFRSYGDIFRQLYLIPQHNTKAPSHSSTTLFCSHSTQSEPLSSEASSDPPLLPTWYVNKPASSTNYKKSAPPPPDYVIVVMDARSTTIPTSTQIGDLLASMPDNETKDGFHKKRLETRIKHGKRSVLLGVVDNGIISYLRFSGGGFGPGEWLWEENERRGRQASGSKGRGGGRGGRGRGRGRGGRAK